MSRIQNFFPNLNEVALPATQTTSDDLHDLTRLGITRNEFLGRDADIATLNQAWHNPQINILVITAIGGTGKTALVKQWLSDFPDIADPDIQPYIWSFYAQGTDQNAQTTADTFFDDACAAFGLDRAAYRSAHSQGIALANAIATEPRLVILDGLEPMQHPIDLLEGVVRDPGLQAFCRQLAMRNPGLLVITSRQPVVEIHKEPKVKTYPLEPLSDAEAADLFKAAKIKGTEAEFQAAHQELQGHALSLNLLATYLKYYASGDIRRRDQLPSVLDVPPEHTDAAHLYRVMLAHEDQLTLHSPELILLYLLSLFDGPVGAEEIDLLCQTDITFLRPILHLDPDLMYSAVHRLRTHSLLNDHIRRPGTPQDTDRIGYPLDTHPVIRQYFAERFRTKQATHWRKAHMALYEYYRDIPEQDQPDSLEEMQPLFAAVRHGCAAGWHHAAFDTVYYPRIDRAGEGHLAQHLGAISIDLAVLAHFFAHTWDTPIAGLVDWEKAFVLNGAALWLQALGRLPEAIQPMQAGLHMLIAQQAWNNATIAARNLSELHLIRGEIADAIDLAQQGIRFAEQTEDNLFSQMASHARLANALLQVGDYAKAGAAFAEAEQIQQEDQPESPQLYSGQGYDYCVWWLSAGEWQAVQQRAIYGLQIARRNTWLRDIGLDQVSLGRANLQQALAELSFDQYSDPEDEIPLAPDAQLWLPEQMPGWAETSQSLEPVIAALDQAEQRLNSAVDALRTSNREDHIPRGLLARAAALRFRSVIIPDQYPSAMAQAADDLREVADTASRSGMLLFLADYYLEAARWALTWPDLAQDPAWAMPMGELSAAGHIQCAQDLMDQTGYGLPKPAVQHLLAHMAS